MPFFLLVLRALSRGYESHPRGLTAMAGRIIPRCRTNPKFRGRLGPQQKANRIAPYARDGAQKGRLVGRVA